MFSSENPLIKDESSETQLLKEQEEKFINAGYKLEPLCNSYNYSSELRKKLKILIKEIELLRSRNQESTIKLTLVLTQTYDLLQGNCSTLQYKASANKVQGNPSPGMKIIGGIMLALCALFIGLTFIPPPISTAMAATCLLTSSAFFVSGSQKGLSAKMNNLACAMDDETLYKKNKLNNSR